MPVGGWGTAQQNQYPQNQYAQPQYPQNQYPQAQAPYPQPPQPNSQKSKRSGPATAIVIGILIVALVAIGGLFGLRALSGSEGPIEGTVDQCHIAVDGTLTASGTVTSDEALDTTLEVRFDDAANGAQVDRTTVDAAGSAGEQVQWSATGQAPEDVKRVTCTMRAAD